MVLSALRVVIKPFLHDLKTCAKVTVECEDDRRWFAIRVWPFADEVTVPENVKSVAALVSALESS